MKNHQINIFCNRNRVIRMNLLLHRNKDLNIKQGKIGP